MECIKIEASCKVWPEWRDINKVQIKWFKQHRSDNVPVSSTLWWQFLFFLNFNFKLMYIVEYMEIYNYRKAIFIIYKSEL